MKAKQFIKSHKTVCIIIAAAVLVAVIAFAGYEGWLYNQPKFHDVTVELGTESVKLSDFMTKYTRKNKVSFVSDVSVIDLNDVGTTELVLAHGRKQETVTLTVQDTTAPEVEFITEVNYSADSVLNAADFVLSVSDFSEYTIAFEEEPKIPTDYSNLTTKVIVSDIYGNAVSEECTASFSWLRDQVYLEFGRELTKADIIYNMAKDGQRINQTYIDEINASPIGVYTINSVIGDRTMTCTVTVQDTIGPELTLQEVQLYVGETTDVDEFVVSCEDFSGVADIRIITEIDYEIKGEQTVIIEAEDIYGNITSADTVLWISEDHNPPEFSGLYALDCEKYSTPDYTYGVYAYDDVDGTVSFTYDASSVNTSVAGTYYVTYTARDSSGNVTSVKRRVDVLHDSADTAAMVSQIAASLPSDPETIRDYVREYIYYSTDWGGSDPVWYGFTNRTGNCYVHALCLQALLSEKGYTTQLIWVTDQSHYWLIINLNGTWWHIDATPSSLHSLYSLMNDEQRLSTLSGRTWDTSMWPACG